jgi:hypothetical protein
MQNQDHPSINSLRHAIYKLSVYERDATKRGDFLVANSILQTIGQADCLCTELTKALSQHKNDIPEPIAHIFAMGFNQIIDRGEYLMELANLHEQAADERLTSISTKPQSVAASQALARPDSVSILFA